VSSFQGILSTTRFTTAATPGATAQTSSIRSARDSLGSAPDDWFDAQSVSGVPDEGLITVVEQESESDNRHDESTDDDDDLNALRAGAVSPLLTMAPALSAAKKELYPLGEWRGRVIKRRMTLPRQITIPPPSLLAFLRKNVSLLRHNSDAQVGKDFSTIAMPVTSNEPTTLLQRLPEDLEYSHLLDHASTTPIPSQKMLYLALFAQSFMSSLRSPKRALRKSFTSLLGETYELVREDCGWRFVSEKVSHRPQIFAAHAESEHWQWSFCPSPRQKFWGKSFEMTIEGTVRVILVGSGEVITWQKPACYMRNIIAGEKYVEPVGEIIVWNHTTGEKAVVEFKPAKGMWGGRSEEVAITTYTKDGTVDVQAEGKWTENIKLITSGEELWKVGPLVENDEKFCGFPVFSAQLSEMTALEEGFIPPTDSRLRPDRKLYELGDNNEAEVVKVRLEEEQRVRRRVGTEPPVRWFEKVTMETEGLGRPNGVNLGAAQGIGSDIGSDSEEGGLEEVWRIKEGKLGYWAQRENNNWDGVIKLW
jgi:oxysterol-binding protein-related protein 3/6/7